MGTLTVTYDGTSKDYTMSGAPAVSYGGGIIGGLSAGSWSGTKTLKCGGQWMTTDVTVGARTLKTAGTLAKTDIQLKYTVNSTVKYQTITTSGTFTVPSPYNMVQFFAVGGGGGGYYDLSSSSVISGLPSFGGGGGGYTKLSSEIATSAGAIYTIVVGDGGTRTNGGNTLVQNSSSNTIITASGGKGGLTSIITASTKYTTNITYGRAYVGCAGGSGGGGGVDYLNFKNAASKAPSFTNYQSGGSNGGNGIAGKVITTQEDTESSNVSIVATADVSGGAGQGTSTVFNGVTYAGGGGGSIAAYYSKVSNSLGGSGGGGKGAYQGYSSSNTRGAGTDGTPGTGGGGGGGITKRYSGSYYCMKGGQGGSGVVIAKLWEV